MCRVDELVNAQIHSLVEVERAPEVALDYHFPLTRGLRAPELEVATFGDRRASLAGRPCLARSQAPR